jgi:hypothetical protein
MYKQMRILPPEEDAQPQQPEAPVLPTAGDHSPEGATVRWSSPPALFAVVGISLVVLCAALATFVITTGGSRDAREPTALAQPAAALAQATVISPTTVPAPPTPSCMAATNYVEIITRQERANRWEDAVATADTGLADTRLCPSERKLLTARAVDDGLKVLYNKPFDPLDVAAQQQEIDRYLSLRQRARDALVSFDTPLQVAGQAYQISQFPLARVAIEEAFAAGDYRPEVDRATTRLYISTLYNLGSWYTHAPAGNALYEQGLGWLAASHQLAVKYQTGQGEAAMLLRQLVGQEEAHWPAPGRTPLLDTK